MQHTNINFKKREERSRHSLYSKITGWSCAILTIFGFFNYLTFIPEQTFAADIVDSTEHRSLSQIDTMQEMSQQICINSRENETKQLRDTRDSKVYWVTKLKDGNCWMTQNLDLDLSNSKSLTSADSDVTSDWTPNNNTRAGSISSGWSGTQTEVQSWDSGSYYYAMDADWTNCGEANVGVASLENCNKWTTTIPAAEGTHYHAGNYYSWNAATAGTGESTTSGQAISSICPKNWKLPTGNTTNKGSFSYLMDQYNITGFNVKDKIRQTPLYFIPAGFTDYTGLRYAGSDGYYWSSTADATNIGRAYAFNLSSSYVGSSIPSNRYPGYSIRCVAEGGWLLDDNQANVSIQVSPIINLDVTKSADDMVVDFNSIDTSTIDINVSSNQKYQVTLTTDQPNLIPNKSDNSEYSIKMVGSNGGVVEKGKNGWGIKKKLSATNDNNLGSLVNEPTYSPIGINNDQVTFYRSAGPEALTNQTDPANPLQLEVGVTVDQSLPSDTYSTMVTVTAMAY